MPSDVVNGMLNRVCRKQIHREVLYKELLDFVAYELIGTSDAQDTIASKWRELSGDA